MKTRAKAAPRAHRGRPERPGRPNGIVRAALTAAAILLIAVAIWWTRREHHVPDAVAADVVPPAPVASRAAGPVARPGPREIQADPGERLANFEDAHQVWTDILACWDEKECPKGSVCWMGDDGRLGCFESNCRSIADKSCPAGKACRPISKTGQLYRCVTAGPIAEGGSCMDPMFAPRSRNCQAGLICVNALCRRLCGPESPCANGDICIQQSPRERACVPGCKGDEDCVGGTTCMRLPGSDRGTCLSPSVAGCRPDRPDSCPAGQACDYQIVDGRMIAGKCRSACRSAGDCPSGSICWGGLDRIDANGSGVCMQTCPYERHGCPSDEMCTSVDEAGSTWACRRAPHSATPAIDVTVARGGFADPVATPR